MSRRRKRKSSFKNAIPSTYNIVKVRVSVPERYSSKLSRKILYAPPINQVKSRSRSSRVPLLYSGRSRKMTLTVAVPRGNRPRPGAVMVRKNQLIIRSDRYVKKALSQSLGRGVAVGENHRRRYSESKRWRRRHHTGYLDSTRRDTGVLGANRNGSIEQLADAALVNAALGGVRW